MWIKVLIVGMLLFIIFNLAMGMVYLIKDQGEGTRTLNALKWRVGLSFVLFIGLLIAVKLGFIQPHTNPLGVKPQVEANSG